jgi:hypothetical protein
MAGTSPLSVSGHFHECGSTQTVTRVAFESPARLQCSMMGQEMWLRSQSGQGNHISCLTGR